MTTESIIIFVLVSALRLIIELITRLDERQIEEQYTNVLTARPAKSYSLDDIAHDIDEPLRQGANQYFKLKPVAKIGQPHDAHVNHKSMSPIRRNP